MPFVRELKLLVLLWQIWKGAAPLLPSQKHHKHSSAANTKQKLSLPHLSLGNDKQATPAMICLWRKRIYLNIIQDLILLSTPWHLMSF